MCVILQNTMTGVLSRLNSDLKLEISKDGGVPTVTLDEQIEVENNVAAMFTVFLSRCSSEACGPTLRRDRHIAYLRKGLRNLPESFVCLDASRPWLVYWALHALELLGIRLEPEEADHVVNFLCHCQSPDGGFGGGPGQLPHLAPTYAAVNALAIIGTDEAYSAIKRQQLLSFLYQMRTEEGAFTMHEGGEIDIRGVYCAVSVARLTNIASESLFRGTAHWVISCQTYEGGFSGAPGLEAHGGYTFCGLAALTLLSAHHMCDCDALLRWGVNRQMRFEGGFQGRTNKLVDGCYSFWQGGLFPILHTILTQEDPMSVSAEQWLFHQEALQEYLLLCCQYQHGGLVDKPGKPPDFYHTCYTLSGMSVAQHFYTGSIHNKKVVGNPSNELLLVHPLFNIGLDSAMQATQHFSGLEVPMLSTVDQLQHQQQNEQNE